MPEIRKTKNREGEVREEEEQANRFLTTNKVFSIE